MVVPMGSNTTIIGNVTACGGLCWLDAGYLSQHFVVSAGASLTLINLALINGAARGSSGTDLTLNGGSVNAGAHTTLSLVNVLFANNSALYGTGGAVFSLGNVVYDAATTFGGLNNTAFAGWELFVCNMSNPFFDNATASCNACPPGQLPFRGKCRLCTTNTYWPGGMPLAGSREAENGECTKCPLLTSTTGQGAPHVAFCNCPAGFYRSPISAVSDPARVKCLPCPTGAFCPGEGDNRPYSLANYWRGTSVDATTFYPCDPRSCVAETFVSIVAYTSYTLGDLSLPYPTATTSAIVRSSADASNMLCSVLHQIDLCVGQSRESNCVKGASGLICSRCAPGYTNQMGVCEPCSANEKVSSWTTSVKVFAAVFGASSAILFVMLLVWYPLMSSQNKLYRLIRVAFSLPSNIFKVASRKLSMMALNEQRELKHGKYKAVLAALGHHFGGLFACIMVIVSNLQVVGSFKDSTSIPWPKAYYSFSPLYRAASIQPLNMPRLACTVPNLQWCVFFVSTTKCALQCELTLWL